MKSNPSSSRRGRTPVLLWTALCLVGTLASIAAGCHSGGGTNGGSGGYDASTSSSGGVMSDDSGGSSGSSGSSGGFGGDDSSTFDVDLGQETGSNSSSGGGPYVCPAGADAGGDAGGCASSEVCCKTQGPLGSSYACTTKGLCGAIATSCTGANNCSNGELCCLAVDALSIGSISCQAPDGGTACPSTALDVLTGQVCNSSAECAGGVACVHYSCAGQSLEACQGSLKGGAAALCSVADGG
jgi:hypothetical protein